MNKKFVPVMLTPFQASHSIDYILLKQLVEFYLKAGAKGLFANCLSSEMFHLTADERLDMVSFIVETVNGRVPVVATGTFPGSVEEQAEFVKRMYATGVESVIVITSLLAAETDTDEVLESNVEKLLELTPNIPLGFYECPVPYKRLLKPSFLAKLIPSGRIRYHKDTSLMMDQVEEKLKVADSNFGLYDAYMVHAVKSLRAGSAGLSCIQGNYFPELVVWLCDHYLEDTEEVQAVQQFFIDQMDVMHATYPASAKYILKKRGLPISEYCRNGSVVGEAYGQLDELYAAYKSLAQRIGLKEI